MEDPWEAGCRHGRRDDRAGKVWRRPSHVNVSEGEAADLMVVIADGDDLVVVMVLVVSKRLDASCQRTELALVVPWRRRRRCRE